MSRAGYSDDLDNWSMIKWRGAVTSAIKGGRGQKLLRELAEAMDAMPEKVLIARELVDHDGDFCALGVVGQCRGLGDKLRDIDPEDPDMVAATFDIAPAMAREIVFENDEGGRWDESPQQRWMRMREWVRQQLHERADIGSTQAETTAGLPSP